MILIKEISKYQLTIDKNDLSNDSPLIDSNFTYLIIFTSRVKLPPLPSIPEAYLKRSLKSSILKAIMEKYPSSTDNSKQQNKSDSEESALDLISDEEQSDVPLAQKESIETKPLIITEERNQTKQQPKVETKVEDNIQGPKRKRRSGEKKHHKSYKNSSDPDKVKKYRPKKQFSEEQKISEALKPEKVSILEKIEAAEILKKPTVIKDESIRDLQWTVHNVDSDTQDIRETNEGEEQPNEDIQKTAILQEDEIDNLTARNQEDELNEGMIEKVTLKYEHWVQNKHLLVLYLLFRKEIYEHFPKKVNRRIDIHPSNKNKIRIFGSSQQELKEISTKISEIIQKIAIVKLNIRNEEATKLKSSKLLNDRLLKDKMVIFRYGNSGEKSYYLGGKGSQPQLSAVFKDIRNLKFRYFRMFDYKNTRSYNIMLGYFVRQKQVLKAFSKWGIKNIELVAYIPSFNNNGARRGDKQKGLCFLMTTGSNTENLSPKQIQLGLGGYIRENYYSIILIFKQGQKYLPKLKVQGIEFRYVMQRKLGWGYAFIMCLRRDFGQKRQMIIGEIQRLEMRNRIIGVRYFDNISPERDEYVKDERYKEVLYPVDGAYSSSIIVRRVGKGDGGRRRRREGKEGRVEERSQKMEGRVQQKKQQKDEALNKEDKSANKQQKKQQQEKQEEGWQQFDWRQHLMRIGGESMRIGGESSQKPQQKEQKTNQKQTKQKQVKK